MKQLKKYKILFVMLSLGGGGAEKMLIHLLRHINRNLFWPVLAVFNKTGFYLNQIPVDVVTIDLGKKSPMSFFRLVRQLSKIIQKVKPALIISFLSYPNYITILARFISQFNAPIILSEQNNLSKSLANQRFGNAKARIVRLTYPKAQRIIAASQGVKKDLIDRYFISPDKCFVIYNSIEMEKITELAKAQINHPWFGDEVPIITTAGRLTRQKNYPLLIEAFAKAQRNTKIRLSILGEGEDRNSLEELVNKLGIQDKVVFFDFQKNPFKYITKSDIFVLSSSWEGFGIVIIEAMACGVPVISTSCPSGPDEIITNGVNGLLVPVNDTEAMADAILKLLKDEPLRKRLADAGKKRAEDFRVEKMIARYEKVFKDIIIDRQAK